MLEYPNIDPVIVSIGPLKIQWYGMAYIGGIIGGAMFGYKRLCKGMGLSMDQFINLVYAIVVGILLGGRLGYVIFYDWGYYWSNPASILAIWQGGMSYHGGAIGAMLGCIIFSYQNKVRVWGILDILGISSTIGIFFGRLANFINGELYGRVTTHPWGMIFPGGGPEPRHPSQLYEAGLEGLLLFGILYTCMTRCQLKEGQLFGLYMAGYGSLRFLIEFVREPDAHLGPILGPLTMGQLLCLIMITAGITLYQYQTQKKAPS
ncbi:MAG: prolipoprotein diacylglyceryl transferase [Actinobacteria bacterium]|nr:prolipoprotein diacylglyceryl transferase [Actinomycetota bacterium]